LLTLVKHNHYVTAHPGSSVVSLKTRRYQTNKYWTALRLCKRRFYTIFTVITFT